MFDKRIINYIKLNTFEFYIDDLMRDEYNKVKSNKIDLCYFFSVKINSPILRDFVKELRLLSITQKLDFETEKVLDLFLGIVNVIEDVSNLDEIKDNSIIVNLDEKSQNEYNKNESKKEHSKNLVLLSLKSKNEILIEYSKMVFDFVEKNGYLGNGFRTISNKILDKFHLNFYEEPVIDLDYFNKLSNNKIQIKLTKKERNLYERRADINGHIENMKMIAQISKDKKMIELFDVLYKEYKYTEKNKNSSIKGKLNDDEMETIRQRYSKYRELKNLFVNAYQIVNDVKESFLLKYDEFVNESSNDDEYKIYDCINLNFKKVKIFVYKNWFCRVGSDMAHLAGDGQIFYNGMYYNDISPMSAIYKNKPFNKIETLMAEVDDWFLYDKGLLEYSKKMFYKKYQLKNGQYFKI